MKTILKHTCYFALACVAAFMLSASMCGGMMGAVMLAKWLGIHP